MNSKYSPTNLSQVPYGGLGSIEDAKKVAHLILQKYDSNKNGLLGVEKINNMMGDAYRSMNKSFTPSKADLETFMRVLDTNKDNIVTYDDIYNICFKFLVGHDDIPSGHRRKEVTKMAVIKIKTNLPNYPVARTRLEVARRLFKQFDVDKSGFLDETEVGPLITETYRQMGVYDFEPTSEDIEVFMRMGDQNYDKKISLEEYEDLVLQSLIKSGIKLN